LFVSANALASMPFSYAIDDGATTASGGVITAACPAGFSCVNQEANGDGILIRKVTGVVEGQTMTFLQNIILDDTTSALNAGFASETLVRQLGNATILNTGNQVAAKNRIDDGAGFVYSTEALEGGFRTGGSLATWTAPTQGLNNGFLSPFTISDMTLDMGSGISQTWAFRGNGGGNGPSVYAVSQEDSNADNAAGDFLFASRGGANYGEGLTAGATGTTLTTQGGGSVTLSNPYTGASNSSGATAVVISAGQAVDQNLFGFQRFSAFNPIAPTTGTLYVNLNANPSALAAGLVNGIAGTTGMVDNDPTANGTVGTTTGVNLVSASTSTTYTSINSAAVLWDTNADAIFNPSGVLGTLPF